MGMPTATVNYSAKLVTGSAVSEGQVLINSGTAFVLASAANRTLYGRADGIAVTSSTVGGSCVMISYGRVDAALTGLGAGTATWVRVTSGGGLERCTPSGVDDVVGWAETNGDVHFMFGFITASIASAASALPPLDGALKVLRTNSTNDGVEWATLTTAPAGSDGDIQYNDSGAFGADSELHYDKAKHSLATGGSTATGDRAIALGFDNTASGDHSFCAGRQSFATSTNSICIGSTASAAAVAGTAIGEQNIADGDPNCSAFGWQSNSAGLASVAIGFQCVTTSGAVGAFACGAGATAIHPGEFAHSSGGWNAEGEHGIDLYVEVNGAAAALTMTDGNPLTMVNNRAISMNVRLVAHSVDKTKIAHEVRELLILSDSSGVMTIEDVTTVNAAPAGDDVTPDGFAVYGWSMTITAESAYELRFSFDPGSDQVHVMARVKWACIGGLAA